MQDGEGERIAKRLQILLGSRGYLATLYELQLASSAAGQSDKVTRTTVATPC
jgi:hypothetical protein